MWSPRFEQVSGIHLAVTELYAQAKSNMFMNGILSSANTDPSFTLSVQTPAGLVEQPAITSISHVYFVAFLTGVDRETLTFSGARREKTPFFVAVFS